MTMKTSAFAMLLLLGACGSASTNQAAENAGGAETTDAVTAEAIRDTQAATNDAEAAADAELDRLGTGNGIEDRSAPAPMSNRDDRVSNTTSVTVY